MESRGSDFYNANQLENDEAKRRVIPNLPRRPQPTFIEKTNNQTNPANTLDTSFQRSPHFENLQDLANGTDHFSSLNARVASGGK